ncbi:DUF2326 domain-containing protein [Chryseobacterium sp.]|uniref:DUF2326 domain-containing protein n=1 Tax=Chryseobacterium sp. TaxID=1871047 RepID=UPI0012A83E74|nr:DUF2326 domain-containing protein [Chryseobacterium sp.]QFG52956.1 hypothetical protein F7R58_05135 [Chryseobacterium sp.]
MLVEIKNINFTDKKIIFSQGLNTVLGDSLSSNSIGKSTLLMIIDFVFGGDSFLSKDSGTVKELGHQTFNFQFQFNNKNYFYSRNTEFSNLVRICDENYNHLADLKTDDYLKELKGLYNISLDLSFRSIVSVYSRVWGKENNNVDKPLQSYLKQSEKESIEVLIKLFNSYESISKLNEQIKIKSEQKRAIDASHKQNFVSKINKTQYNENQNELKRISSSIDAIKENLLSFVVNVEELTSKELIDLKIKKSELIKRQAEISNKIERIELNLNKKSVKSQYFKKLSEFIPSTNEEKLQEIENFHNKISEILNRELIASKAKLEEEFSLYETEINNVSIKINQLLENIESPKFVIDKLHDLTIQEENIKRTNKFYVEKIETTNIIKELGVSLDNSIHSILVDISSQINTELIRINEIIHSKDKKVPYLKLKINSYTYNHSGDDGTGKSYSDLIEFDLAILNLTQLPFLIHDSPFFKNIGDLVMENIINFYSKFEKQIFISIDGISKYSNTTQQILVKNKSIQLSDKHQLFIKDWRKK